jgi:hypothetical protein
MKDLIKSKLDEYLEFDSNILFNNKWNLVRVFGGAIRDSIANQPINDVDILVGSKALKEIEFILENKGYHYMEMLNGKDLQVMYNDIHIITEPHTWVKVSMTGAKIVQLIKPVVFNQENDFIKYRQGFLDLISNVDFSCCGVSWDGDEVYEDYPNSIVHCQNKVFSVNKSAKMYSDKRVIHRKVKLQNRGWKEIEYGIDINRELKLNVLYK